MRLVHTSDWHLGRLTSNVSRRDDHIAVHAEIIAYAKEFRPDLILHTGDLFDANMPSVDDIRLGLDMLAELSAIAPAVVLCGNHENPKLFSLFERLCGNERLRFVDKPRSPKDGGILEFAADDGREKIRLAAVPFVRNTTYISEFRDPADWTNVYEDNLTYVERVYAEALANSHQRGDISIFAAHLHVKGAVLANSERTVHLDDYGTRADLIPPVTYAAFGHIHKPQAIAGRSWARYAGSPIQLDFGEVGEQKSVVLVEAEPGANARVRVEPLNAGRQLRRARGTLAELQANASALAGSLAQITVDEAQSSDLMERVEAALPGVHIVRLNVVDPSNKSAAITAETTSQEPPLEELFDHFLIERSRPEANNERVAEIFRDALAAARAGTELRIEGLGDIEVLA